MATLEERAALLGCDLVLEGGGVKGIGLVGAIDTLVERGYVFPRVGGTSAGAIVAALVAAYQHAGIPLKRLDTDMRELRYAAFTEGDWGEQHLGLVGKAVALVRHQGLYDAHYLDTWLSERLESAGVRTFGDLKITSDTHTSLPPTQRYRLVVHTADLTRRALVRLPWDLPFYLLPHGDQAPVEEQIAAIDAYPVADAVRASMAIPFFFEPVQQPTTNGACTWVDGGMLQNFPITVFDRTDGKPGRWPTYGIKLSARPPAEDIDHPVRNDLTEILAIAHTALGEWNRYRLTNEGTSARTMYVDTFGVKATDFGLTPDIQNKLYDSGTAAATQFLGERAVAQNT